jgi:hypothetical protein
MARICTRCHKIFKTSHQQRYHTRKCQLKIPLTIQYHLLYKLYSTISGKLKHTSDFDVNVCGNILLYDLARHIGIKNVQLIGRYIKIHKFSSIQHYTPCVSLNNIIYDIVHFSMERRFDEELTFSASKGPFKDCKLVNDAQNDSRFYILKHTVSTKNTHYYWTNIYPDMSRYTRLIPEILRDYRISVVE